MRCISLFTFSIRAAAPGRSKPWLVTACLLATLSARQAEAFDLTTVAGSVDGDSVTVADADRAAGNVAVPAWRAMDGIVRTAVRALCVERIHSLLAEADGLDPVGWRARIWKTTEPTPDEVAAYARGRSPETDEDPDDLEEPDLVALAHVMHVGAYRAKLARAAERMLEEDLVWQIGAPEESPAGAPVLPEKVATCVGRPVTAEEVRRYAAAPLRDREAELVAALCAEFELDPPKPLVLERIAAREGRSLEQLLAEIEGGASEISPSEVEREALDRFGRTDEGSLVAARSAIEARRRADRRRAWMEKVRRESRVRCDLAAPPNARADVRSRGVAAGPSNALPVVYFGNFACPRCSAGWLTLRRVMAARQQDVRIEFRHHFPETDAGLFTQALEAECAAAQGRFFQYGDWRTSVAPQHVPGAVLQLSGIDPVALAGCMADPRTAVEVLEDTSDALRLGFREAVPSWVVAERVRRGELSENDIERDIADQAAKRSAAEQPKQPAPSSAGAAGPAKQPAPSSSGAAGQAKP